jgi:hypothetical protein
MNIVSIYKRVIGLDVHQAQITGWRDRRHTLRVVATRRTA